MFSTRPYQTPLFRAMDGGFDRAFVVWHRRSGKDKAMWNLMVKKALERVGTYFYCFPTYAQGRKALWDAIDNDGFKLLDHIPKILLQGVPSSQEMKIKLVNGSIIQVVGTDDPDRIRGTNAVGWVFSEYAWHNPIVWTAIATPVLRANKGWAAFNTTPFGKNHAHDLFHAAQDSDRWFTQVLSIDDTQDEQGSPIILLDDLEEERRNGMSEELIQQEFYCDWNANSQGYYYLKYMNEAEQEGRITRVPFTPEIKVDTWWDIGVGDSTAIWFTQIVDKEIHVIDFYQSSSEGLEHYAKYLQSLPYVYGVHNFPHDMAVTEYGTGKSRLEVAEELLPGQNLNIIQKLGLEDGINAVRVVLPRCWFDKNKCEEGLQGLKNYRRLYDDKLREFKQKPVHDFASHPSDAFRYLAVGLTMPRKSRSSLMARNIKKIAIKSWQLA